MIMFILSACGSGGSGSGGGSTSNGAGSNTSGSSVFSITYTNTTDTDGLSIVPAIDFFTEWFVENTDGSVRGPYTSAGTGTVLLGQEGRATANLTMSEGSIYYATYMDAPVQPLTFFTGENVGTTSVRVSLQNTGATGEMLLNVPYRGVMQVTTDPAQFYSSTVSTGEILGTDNLAGIFIGYRTSSLQEPASLYDFGGRIPWNSVGSQSFDVSSMKAMRPGHGRALTISAVSLRGRATKGLISTRSGAARSRMSPAQPASSGPGPVPGRPLVPGQRLHNPENSETIQPGFVFHPIDPPRSLH
jgi:hypothetical protein